MGLFAGDAVRLAMVFPGQGSQALGMLRGYDGLPEIDRVIAEARDALGGEFIRLMNEGPAEALNQTVNTQPAMVTAGEAGHPAGGGLRGPAPPPAAGAHPRGVPARVARRGPRFPGAPPLVRVP